MNRLMLLPALAGLAMLTMAPVYGQGKGQNPTPTTPSPGGNTPRTPTPTTPTTPNIPGQQQQQQPGLGQRTDPFAQQPYFLSGKVMMDDGTPPPEPAAIELVCGSNRRRQAWTDSKGRFSFRIGENSVMPDASESGQGERGFGSFGNPAARGPANLLGCELRADLAGFRSDMVNLSNRRTLDNPDVGTILLHRLANTEGTTISATSLEAPKDAKKAFDKGSEAMRKQKWDEAEKQFQKAVDAYPRYATAWFELGQLYRERQKPDDARKAFAQALTADPKYVKPLAQLALMSAQEQKWQDVADTTNRLLRLDPFSYPMAHYYNSLAYFQLHDLDKAEKSAREAVKMDPEHRFPKSNHLLGVILANKGTYGEAADNIRNYLKYAPDAGDAELAKKQLSEIEKVSAAKAAQPQQ